jgi:hypothetical protein
MPGLSECPSLAALGPRSRPLDVLRRNIRRLRWRLKPTIRRLVATIAERTGFCGSFTSLQLILQRCEELLLQPAEFGLLR